tara:strand:- start:276 stop:632 length:357 start_codon:yes stop_codon:yes gene_type:complete
MNIIFCSTCFVRVLRLAVRGLGVGGGGEAAATAGEYESTVMLEYAPPATECEWSSLSAAESSALIPCVAGLVRELQRSDSLASFVEGGGEEDDNEPSMVDTLFRLCAVAFESASASGA